MPLNIPRRKPGDPPLSAAEIDAILDELARLGKWHASAPLELTEGAGGFAMAYAGVGSDGPISVFLTQVGGTQGSQSTKPSWTYDCENTITGTVYSAIAANFQRCNGRVLPGLIGEGRIVDGVFLLDRADEVPYTYSCPP